MAYDLRILDLFKKDIRKKGVVGEETTAATVKLIIVTRLLGGPGSKSKPTSAIVKGDSSSGKSYTVESTVRFFPPEAVLEMTAMSERALVYSKEDFKHRTIVLYEAVALREGVQDNLTAYLLRSLLSEGRLEYPVTVRAKDGNWTTKTIVKEGPTNLILTTTKVSIHAENETRALSLTTDDTPDQTQRVFRELANEGEGGVDLEPWHQLHRWLRTAEHRVTIPFGPALAELVPPVAIRLRRDFGAVLALIRAHAILHQLNRPRDSEGRIIATLDDYEVVRDLIAGVVSEGVGATVSPTVRDTVEAVSALAGVHQDGVTATALAEKLGLDKSAARRRLLMAKRDGYITNREERRGHPGRWVIGEPLPEEKELLPPRHRLENRTAGQASGGTVARGSEGDKGVGP
ncbi:MAG: hypothetical protein H0V97_05945 [Actinobacteria bacterium]|nr:hypothetical protein [Actinomycetota bacterium]